jgi:TetR/AcrR family transcriptional repressor of nem operon
MAPSTGTSRRRTTSSPPLSPTSFRPRSRDWRRSPPGRIIAAFIRQYLSPQHRDDPAEGCPSAALLDEIARQSPSPSARHTPREPTDVIATLADRLAGDHTRARAISLFTLLVSSMQLARAVTEPSLSEEVLDSAYESARRIAALAPQENG